MVMEAHGKTHTHTQNNDEKMMSDQMKTYLMWWRRMAARTPKQKKKDEKMTSDQKKTDLMLTETHGRTKDRKKEKRMSDKKEDWHDADGDGMTAPHQQKRKEKEQKYEKNDEW